MLGNAAVREIFKVSKVGASPVAGRPTASSSAAPRCASSVTRGVDQGKLSQLKRFKDDARESVAGQECGMAFENYQDMKVGDVIECLPRGERAAHAVSSRLNVAKMFPPSSPVFYRAIQLPARSIVRKVRWLPGSSPGMTKKKMARQQHRDQTAGGSQRQLRAGELIRHELADMFSRGDIHDPVIQGHMITVPEVRMSADLRLATIYIMPLGGRDVKEVLDALDRNKRYVRGEIARRVNLKFAPEICFRIDARFDEAERIDKLFLNAQLRDLAAENDDNE